MLCDRYKSGPLIEVMLDFLNERNIRALDMSDKEPRFHSLEKFLKKLRIIVKTGNNGGRSRIKCIRGLVPAGGEFTFHKESEGKTVTVAVRSILLGRYTTPADFSSSRRNTSKPRITWIANSLG